jgi:D-alanyl-D-alanine carboxypeptidase
MTDRQNVDFVAYPQTWVNSNKLLSVPGFVGCKTGVTNTAGSCLCVAFDNKTLGKRLVTVVLGCRNIEYRWKDTFKLTLWANQLIERQHSMAPLMASSPSAIDRLVKGQSTIEKP